MTILAEGTGASGARSVGIAAAAILLSAGFLFGVCAWVAATHSATFDEPSRIGVGLRYLRTGDPSDGAMIWNPPLLPLIGSLPLLARDSDGRYTEAVLIHRGSYGLDLLYHAPDPPERLLWISRLPVALLAAALALLLGWVSFRRHGAAGGVLSAFLWATCPLVVSMGGLLAADIPVALGFVATVLAFRAMIQGRLRGGPWITGALLGLAVSAKLTAVYLVPGLALAGAVSVVRETAGTRAASARRRVRQGLIAVFAAFLVLWALYGFELRPVTTAAVRPHAAIDRWVPPESSWHDRLYRWCEATPVPMPSFIRSVLWSSDYSRLGYDQYFLGEFSRWGWRSYYIVGLALKLPVGHLLLLTAGLALLAYRARRFSGGDRGNDGEEAGATLLLEGIPTAVYVIALSFSAIQLGVRYVLPAVAMACLWAGGLLAGSVSKRRRIGVAAASLASFASLVAVMPHPIAYFNELTGGPARGAQYLLDSNLDWGQDLRTLERVVAERKIDRLYLDYFGIEDPARYRIPFVKIEGRPPGPGWLAVSATFRKGLFRPDRRDLYRWLDGVEPVERIGWSIYLYRIGDTPR